MYTHEELREWLQTHRIGGGNGLFSGQGAGSTAKEAISNTNQGEANLNNVFNWALPTGSNTFAQGSQTLNQAKSYFQNLLTAGRTQTAQNAAPAINAAGGQADAARRQAGAFGTGRTGGTAAIADQAQTSTNASVDQIINQNLVGGQQAGAQGLTQIGGTQLQAALSALGLGTSAANSSASISSGDWQVAAKEQWQEQAQVGQAFSALLLGGGV